MHISTYVYINIDWLETLILLSFVTIAQVRHLDTSPVKLHLLLVPTSDAIAPPVTAQETRLGPARSRRRCERWHVDCRNTLLLRKDVPLFVSVRFAQKRRNIENDATKKMDPRDNYVLHSSGGWEKRNSRRFFGENSNSLFPSQDED